MGKTRFTSRPWGTREPFMLAGPVSATDARTVTELPMHCFTCFTASIAGARCNSTVGTHR
jgi:hypothetical protein